MEITDRVHEMIMDVVRTVIKSYGGVLVAKGFLTSDQVTMLAGGAAIAVGLLWSWVSTVYFTKKKEVPLT